MRLELASLARLAGEIGWQFNKPIKLLDRIPAQSTVAPVRNLLQQHGKLVANQQNAQMTLKETQDSIQVLKERLEEFGDLVDVSELSAVLETIQDLGDISGRIRSTEEQREQISDQIKTKYSTMTPALPPNTDLESLVVPSKDTVVSYRDDMRNLTVRKSEIKRDRSATCNDLEDLQQKLEHRERDEGLEKLETVKNVRRYRDGMWNLVKTRYITHSEITVAETKTYAKELENLPTSFEEAVESADGVADQHIDKATVLGELRGIENQISTLKTRINQLDTEENERQIEQDKLEKEWRKIWAKVPCKIQSPNDMLTWMEMRDEIIGLSGRERDFLVQLNISKEEEQKAFSQIHAALKSVGWNADDFEGKELPIIVKLADAYLNDQRGKSEKLKELRSEVRQRTSEEKMRKREIETADSELKKWQQEWDVAVSTLDLDPHNKPEVLTEQINVIDEMREHATAARNLRDKRIGTIERDIRQFESTLECLVRQLAPDLTTADVNACIDALRTRGEKALKLHDQQLELDKTLMDLQAEIKELNKDQQLAWASMQPVLEASGVSDFEELPAAIARSDRYRISSHQKDEVIDELHQQGNGLAIDILESECQNVDIDDVVVREKSIDDELPALRAKLEEASIKEADARREFEAIGGDDKAARAAADYEEALAVIKDTAERYVRARTSEKLLGWVVDRYRKEKQGPLLRRAGELFQVLTRGSFEKLEAKYDEQDSPTLVGIRPSGEPVPMSGLSSGTEDQLFLALRLAAVEDYLARTQGLPFIADDLFINFDHERSEAGFEVLGQLAERTQVLFFTHHQHLVDLATVTLGANVHVVVLNHTT